ncbi:Checkpoint protein hus1-like protein [Bienertia sinuspersici]
MKFKAFLTENGVILLERRFIPALEKMGKICHVYLTKDHTFFLHNLLTNDGVQSIAQFRKDALFSDYRISSQNEDRIGFSLDLSLLLRALRSAAAISSAMDRLQIKLVKKLPPNSTTPMPFLTFETKGYASAVIQDIPISKPLSRSQVLELQTALDDAQELPRTLVGVSELDRMLHFVEKMKQLGDVMGVEIGKNGELGLKVSSSLVTLGAEFKRLMIVGEDNEDSNGDNGMNVLVSMKHFVKCLQCHLAKPDCAFYGVGSQSGSLTVVFQFFVPGSRQTDKSISFHCRLPLLDPGS